MHSDLEPVVIAVDGSDRGAMLALDKAMNEWQDEMSLYIKSVATELNIGFGQAADIVYLRGRSRWTQEKEDYLIQLAREGKAFPDILGGAF